MFPCLSNLHATLSRVIASSPLLHTFKCVSYLVYHVDQVVQINLLFEIGVNGRHFCPSLAIFFKINLVDVRVNDRFFVSFLGNDWGKVTFVTLGGVFCHRVFETAHTVSTSCRCRLYLLSISILANSTHHRRRILQFRTKHSRPSWGKSWVSCYNLMGVPSLSSNQWTFNLIIITAFKYFTVEYVLQLHHVN